MNIGIDIEQCARLANLLTDKVFAPRELAYLQSKNNALPTAAGLFCAKEAYFKAKGTGVLRQQLPQVEIGHDANGKPYYVNDPAAVLSISHTADTAVAVCIIF